MIGAWTIECLDWNKVAGVYDVARFFVVGFGLFEELLSQFLTNEQANRHQLKF